MTEFCIIPRPTNATLRPKRAASRTRICTRNRLDENVATTSIPVADVKISSKAPMTSISEPVKPRRSMLVLSASSASTPSEPSVAKRCRSTCWPSSGVWSTLKSPVWTSVPAGVCSASPTQSGMLCVTRRNSTVIEPMTMRSPGATVTSLSPGSIWCSSSLGSTSASVSGVPYTGPFEQRPHVGHPADVVLVSVRQDEGRDAAVLQVRQVGHDEIHAQQVRARKHHAGINARWWSPRRRRPSCSCRTHRPRRAGRSRARRWTENASSLRRRPGRTPGRSDTCPGTHDVRDIRESQSTSAGAHVNGAGRWDSLKNT